MARTKLSVRAGSDAEAALLLAKRPEALQGWLDWVATPKPERDPPTIAALARHLGVSENTIYVWGRDPRLQRAQQGAVAALAQRHMPDVVARLATVAIEGTPSQVASAANMLFKIIADDRDDRDHVSEAVESAKADVHSLTTDQLRDLASALESAADEVDGKPVVVE